jgi:hypothetical protein
MVKGEKNLAPPIKNPHYRCLAVPWNLEGPRALAGPVTRSAFQLVWPATIPNTVEWSVEDSERPERINNLFGGELPGLCAHFASPAVFELLGWPAGTGKPGFTSEENLGRKKMEVFLHIQATSFLDASFLYGSTLERSRRLRTFRDGQPPSYSLGHKCPYSPYSKKPPFPFEAS